jgi:hypothetical protein
MKGMKAMKLMKSPAGRGCPSPFALRQATDGPAPPGPFMAFTDFTSFMS